MNARDVGAWEEGTVSGDMWRCVEMEDVGGFNLTYGSSGFLYWSLALVSCAVEHVGISYT